MLYRTLTIAALVAATLAAPTEEVKCPQTVCIDAINTCGIKYGGCYDRCISSLSPTAPPCSTHITKPPAPTPSPASMDECSSRSVCADYINDCGVWYGGCFADCKPWPTFTPPPCTTTSAAAVVTADQRSIGTPTSASGETETDVNTGTRPSTTTLTFTPSSTPTPTEVKTSAGPSTIAVTVKPSSTPTSCQAPTLCVDYVNACGQGYGGCFAACKPYPTYTPPPCEITVMSSKITIIGRPPKATTMATIPKKKIIG